MVLKSYFIQKGIVPLRVLLYLIKAHINIHMIQIVLVLLEKTFSH